jgi:hypothetical protein
MTGQPFIKSHTELIDLGLPKTMVLMYGVIDFMAGRNGDCWPTHEFLAQRCGLKSTRQVRRNLEGLRRFKLIEWTRGRYFNRYRALAPDWQWIADLLANTDRTRMSHLSGHKCPISDRTFASYRKEASQPKEKRKEAVSQPAYVKGKTGGLAELLTQTWKHIPGSPGAKLVARIAASLGDVPVGHFHQLLVARRAKARSFGLALELAGELRERWNAEATEREQAADAEAQRQIRLAESLLADGGISPDERSELERWLGEQRAANGETRRMPQSETKPPGSGRKKTETGERRA